MSNVRLCFCASGYTNVSTTLCRKNTRVYYESTKNPKPQIYMTILELVMGLNMENNDPMVALI